MLDHDHSVPSSQLILSKSSRSPAASSTDTPETGSSSRIIRGHETIARAISRRR